MSDTHGNSRFPNGLDSWDEFLDVTDNDAQYLRQYQQFVLNGEMENAQRVYSQISNADRKFIGALIMNQFADAIMSLEDFYGDSGFEAYTTLKQEEWQEIIDRFTYVGEYNSATTYFKNNIVLYNVNGQNYLYLNIHSGETTNVLPTDSNYWRIFTIQGQKGDAGNATAFYFEWRPEIEYKTNNVVCVDSSLYVALQDNVNTLPYVGSVTWERIFTMPQMHYPVQASQPSGAVAGDLWFRIIE